MIPSPQLVVFVTSLYSDLEKRFQQIGVDRSGMAVIKEDRADDSRFFFFFSSFPIIAAERF